MSSGSGGSSKKDRRISLDSDSSDGVEIVGVYAMSNKNKHLNKGKYLPQTETNIGSGTMTNTMSNSNHVTAQKVGGVKKDDISKILATNPNSGEELDVLQIMKDLKELQVY